MASVVRPEWWDPTFAALFVMWGILLVIALWNLGDDLTALSTKKPKPSQPDRRFIEPCAAEMHEWGEAGVCARCQAIREDTEKQ